jgi:uncharacterized membrane protein
MGKKSRNKTKHKTVGAQARQPNDKREQVAKRDVVRGQSKGGKGTFVGLGVVAVVIAVVGLVLFGGGEGGFKAVAAEAGMVRIPIDEVNDGKAHFYSYNGSRRVDFFVLRSSDGIVRAAFDACDVCFREKKGYRQEGDLMVCNNCGQRFPSVKINVLKGGCNPAPLDREVQGRYLVVKAADIEQGGYYF